MRQVYYYQTLYMPYFIGRNELSERLAKINLVPLPIAVPEPLPDFSGNLRNAFDAALDNMDVDNLSGQLWALFKGTEFYDEDDVPF